MKIPASRVVALLFVAMAFVNAESQSQFVGKWQTKISSVTRKHSITVNIFAREGKFSGTVVLVNPDGSEIESEASNAKLNGKTLEFETKTKNDAFHWRLTLKNSNAEGLLHGSIREMVIDERVVKQY